MKNLYNVLRTTIEIDYLIPMIDDKITKLDNRSSNELINEFFIIHDINNNHTSRDSLLFNKKLIKIQMFPIEKTEYNL